MATFYEEMAATATDLITQFGRDVSLVRTSGTPDPIEGEMSGPTEELLPTKGVFVSSTVRWVAESLAAGADRVCLIDASVEPKMADVLQAGSEVFAIVDIKRINPAGTPLAYVLHVKR